MTKNKVWKKKLFATFAEFLRTSTDFSLFHRVSSCELTVVSKIIIMIRLIFLGGFRNGIVMMEMEMMLCV